MHPSIPTHQSQIDQSLFQAIAQRDYPTAQHLLANNANPNTPFSLPKSAPTSSFNLFIAQTSQMTYRKGHNNSQYLAAMTLMKEMINKANLVCKCKKEHKCPLYAALESMQVMS